MSERWCIHMYKNKLIILWMHSLGCIFPGIILVIGSANERRHYYVTLLSLAEPIHRIIPVLQNISLTLDLGKVSDTNSLLGCGERSVIKNIWVRLTSAGLSAKDERPGLTSSKYSSFNSIG